MLRVATVFSGIGAFEYALRKLNIEHEIVFACDNGERELKYSYKQLRELAKDLSEEQRLQYAKTLWQGNKLESQGMSEEDFYTNLFFKKIQKGRFELTKDSINILTTGMNIYAREQYVKALYALLKTPNYVKLSYMANYILDENNWHEDIRFLDGEQYAGQVDILVGGSPCQSFSTYGKKLGLEDTRGTLFYEYARLIQQTQPRAFVYENVPNITRHDKGRTWEVMLAVWNSLGYRIHYKILNAKDYGIPQNRNRLFLVGIREDLTKDADYLFPLPQPLGDVTSHDFMESKVEPRYYLGQKGFEWVTTPAKNQNRTRANYAIQGCQTATQQDNWTGDLRVEPAQQWHRNDPHIYVGMYKGVESVARKMTPTECLRMMGFDHFNQVVSNKVMYRQSGNSIVVNVLEAIIGSLYEVINFDEPYTLPTKS